MRTSRVREAMGIAETLAVSERKRKGTRSPRRTCPPKNSKLTTKTALHRRQLRSHLHHREGLDHIADLDVTVAGDGDTAFHAVTDFLRVVFEAAQRADLAFVDLYVVAQQAHFGVAFDRA